MHPRKQILKVILGISGGIDSSVAGLILKKQGFDVHGVFMRNWDISDETGKCSVDKDFEDAQKSCSKIGITFSEVNFAKDYWNYVFEYLVDQYQSGYTPNPDILCNRHIKFNKFVKYSLEKLGADAIATGHYAQTTFGNFLEFYDKVKGVNLLKAVDPNKDQTFFLSQVYQKYLQKVMFPLGCLTKPQVKKIAMENNLDHLVRKKESTGICFIGHRNFSQFISEYLPEKHGVFIDIDTGKVVGTHTGIHHWTLGQRCRIGGNPGRFYIARKNPQTQDILVALGEKHKILWSNHVTTNRAHWIHSVPETLQKGRVFRCDFRFQHRDPLIPCKLMMKQDGSLIITLKTPLNALCPGQFAVFYKDNICLGSAEMISHAPNLYSLVKIDHKTQHNSRCS